MTKDRCLKAGLYMESFANSAILGYLFVYSLENILPIVGQREVIARW